MTGFDVLAEGLRFPEGPVLFADGSLAVTEIAGGCITRIDADGAKTTLAETGGDLVAGLAGSGLGDSVTRRIVDDSHEPSAR